MTFNYRYLNKQVFLANVSYTLIIENEDDSEDFIRIEKSFKFPPEIIDSEFLRIEAKKEINRIIKERSEIIIIEVSPDEAASDG